MGLNKEVFLGAGDTTISEESDPVPVTWSSPDKNTRRFGLCVSKLRFQCQLDCFFFFIYKLSKPSGEEEKHLQGKKTVQLTKSSIELDKVMSRLVNMLSSK